MLRARHLEARVAAASSVSARAAAVESRAAFRRDAIELSIERKLESASEARHRRLRAVAFRAADAAARVKSVALALQRERVERQTEWHEKLREASRRRDAHTNRVALRASFFVLRASKAAAHASAAAAHRSAEIFSRLSARLENAETLKGLDVRLRKCKASLVCERASHVVQRRRLSDSVAPMLGAARLRASHARARARREGATRATSDKAGAFVRRAVVTCASNEVRAARFSMEKRARLDARIAAAARRKASFLELGARGLGHPLGGGGPSPPGRFARNEARRRGRAADSPVWSSSGSATEALARRFELSNVVKRPSTSRGASTNSARTTRVSVA